MNPYEFHPTKKEEDYQAFARMGQHLGIPVFEAWLEMEVTLKGERTHYHRQRSHSWTRNAYNVMASQLLGLNGNDATFAGGNLNLKDTGGTMRYGTYGLGFDPNVTFENASTTQPGYRATSGSLVGGIVVGTGTSAESFEDYVLETPVAEGTGAGQMNYAASDVHVESYVAGTLTKTNTLVRYANNNSAADIEINEVALYGRSFANGSVQTVCYARDALGATVIIAVSAQLKVTYTINLVYAA